MGLDAPTVRFDVARSRNSLWWLGDDDRESLVECEGVTFATTTSGYTHALHKLLGKLVVGAYRVRILNGVHQEAGAVVAHTRLPVRSHSAQQGRSASGPIDKAVHSTTPASWAACRAARVESYPQSHLRGIGSDACWW